jgi:hypothetical protein
LTLLLGKVEYFISRTGHAEVVDCQWTVDGTYSDGSFGIGLGNVEIRLEKLIGRVEDDVFCFWIGGINNWKAFFAQ